MPTPHPPPTRYIIVIFWQLIPQPFHAVLYIIYHVYMYAICYNQSNLCLLICRLQNTFPRVFRMHLWRLHDVNDIRKPFASI